MVGRRGGKNDVKKIEIQRRQRLLDGFFKVDEITLRHELADGRMSPPLRRLNLDRGNGVAALLYNRTTKKIVLVRQFRYPASLEGPGWILEIVASMHEAGEVPEDTMRREILEETGYEAEHLEPISSFYLTPGGSSEKIHLFYAETSAPQRRSAGGGVREEGEDIEVVELPLERAWQALDQSEIVDAKTLVALLWCRRKFAAKQPQGRTLPEP